MGLRVQIGAAALSQPVPALPNYSPMRPPANPAPVNDFQTPWGAHPDKGKAFRPRMDSGRSFSPSKLPAVPPALPWLAFIGLFLYPRSTAERTTDEGEKLCRLPPDLEYLEYRMAEEQIRRRQSLNITLEDLIEIARQRAIYCIQNGVDPALCDIPHLLWIIAAQMGLDIRTLSGRAASIPSDAGIVSSASESASNGAATAPTSASQASEDGATAENGGEAPREDREHTRVAKMRAASGALYTHDFGRAVSLFTDLVQFEAETWGRPSSTSLKNLGTACMEAGRLPDAKLVFETAIGLYPDDIPPKIGLARVHIKEKQPATAETLLTDLLQKGQWTGGEREAKGKLLSARAAALLELGRVLEALSDAREAAQLGDQSHFGIYIQLTLLIATGHREEIPGIVRLMSSSKLDKAIRQLRIYGKQYITKRAYVVARTYFEVLLALEGDNPRLPDLSEYGVVLMKLGKYAEALPYFDRLIALGGDNFPENYFRRGAALRRMRRYKSALADLTKASELERQQRGSTFPTTLYEMGVTLSFMKRFGEAKLAFDQAIAAGNRRPNTFYERGRVLQALELYPEAQLDLEEAARRETYKSTTTLILLANVCGSLGNFERALEVLHIIEDREPNNLVMLIMTASFHRRRKNLTVAMDYLGRARDLIDGKTPHSPFEKIMGQFDLEMGLALKELGRNEEALVFLEKAAQTVRPGQRAFALLSQSYVLHSLGRTEEAQETAREAERVKAAGSGPSEED